MSTIVLNPFRIFSEVWLHRYLLGQLVKRDVLLRYRGAMFGVAWIFLSPLLMLAIYAFIFGQVFQTRWPHQESGVPFWLLLYCGLIAFNLFGETVSRAPAAVRGYPSYVKKIIFPLGILPLVPLRSRVGARRLQFLHPGGGTRRDGQFFARHTALPLLLLPAVLLGIGAAWFLAAWGVFIKDMTQIVPLFVQMLLFLSPVFYPASAVPEFLRPVYALNPLGAVIEAARAAILAQPISWPAWGAALLFGAIAALLGHAFFRHSRDEFADAL